MRFSVEPRAGYLLALASGRDTAEEMRTRRHSQPMLAGALKTSGSKGLHIFVPIETVSFEDSAAATRAIAVRAERLDPEVATTAFVKADRGGKVFVDSTRVGGATVIAAYSPRIRPGVPVSFPVAWEDLDGITPAEFTAAQQTVQKAQASYQQVAGPIDKNMSEHVKAAVEHARMEAERLGVGGGTDLARQISEAELAVITLAYVLPLAGVPTPSVGSAAGVSVGATIVMVVVAVSVRPSAPCTVSTTMYCPLSL
mgnify:CR=1 FL=1